MARRFVDVALTLGQARALLQFLREAIGPADHLVPDDVGQLMIQLELTIARAES